MLRNVMISSVVAVVLVGCGDDVAEKAVPEQHAAVETHASAMKNQVNTQDVKKNDSKPVAIQSQSSHASQAVATKLANEQKSLKKQAHPSPAVVLKAEPENVAIVESKPKEIVKPVVSKAKEVVLAVVGDAVNGKRLAKRCSACHSFSMQDKTGPHLKGVYNRAAGHSGFKKHSKALKAADWTWDEAHLLKWVCDSKAAIKEFTGNASAKTKMPKQKMCGDKALDVVAYLKTL